MRKYAILRVSRENKERNMYNQGGAVNWIEVD